MTDDTHGKDPQDPTVETNPENEQPAAPEGEAWSGGSVDDDFSDPAATEDVHPHEEEMTAVAEEEAPVEELSAADDDMDEDIKPVKKRGIMLPAIVTVGGLALLGVLGYWQFGDSLHGEAPAPVSNSSLLIPKAPTAAQIAAPKPTATPTLMPTPQAPTAAALNDAVSPKTDMVAPSPPPAAVVAAQPVQATVSVPVPPPSTKIAEVTVPPSATSPTVNVFTAMAPAPSTAPVAPVTIKATAPDAGTESRLNVLSTHIEDLQRALDQTSQQLNQISARLNENGQQKPSALDEQRLNSLEQKLAQLQNGNAAAEPATTTEEPSLAPAPTPAPKVVKHKTHHTAPAATVTHHKSVKKLASNNMSWVLRAASPNEAWIAKDSVTPDLQSVHVGDDLPGIGHINAITEEGGVWVVYGSRGAIR